MRATRSAGQAARGPGPAASRPDRLARSLPLHLALAAVSGAVCTGIWALAGGWYFWPVWVWLAAAITVVVHAATVRLLRAAPGPRRAFAVHASVAGFLTVLLPLVWLLSSTGTPWPFLVILASAAALAVHAALLLLGPRGRARERTLARRIEELTRSRRGAVDVQTVELRRIERDLHDGAQARLVALSLQLGRAELALGDRPDGASLAPITAMVVAAHHHADLAIAELRELARGIAPPILVDRGLVEAVRALGRRAGVPVTVSADVRRRPPASVEIAAYFVTAEALTNAAKHAGTLEHPATVAVTLAEEGDLLVVRVADDGVGGADPGGGGLTGLAQRVAALDGAFAVTAGPGGVGTVVRAAFGYGG